MNNQREIYEALLAGETLIHAKGFKLKMLDDGKMVNAETEERKEQHFTWPDDWQIHKEPKWYENIPDGGVLCYYAEGDEQIIKVTGYIANDNYPFRVDDGGNTAEPKPLTKAEIQVFLENAPDES